MEDCSFPHDSLFLGFDNSTQSLKATVLNSNFNIVTTEIVKFDSELAHYKTNDGVYRDQLVNGRIVSPTLMWVEAFDLMLERLEKKLDFSKITAVSGSAQQHGSVYWKRGSSKILSSLDSKKPLVHQFRDAFSVKESPIWMDCSTTKQCKAIEEAVGGALELSKLTGSRAHERYAGPQIRKIYEMQPEVYQDTERISMVSSFLASIFIGAYACIDQTDGAGMNLMDIKQRTWSKTALEATAPSLEEKLGNLAPAHAVAGYIAPYFVERFHFNKDCLVVQWSGDNPNSLAGLTLNTPGDLAISLGTSDTVFGITTEHQPRLEGHVFPNPVDTESYMVMLVYKNGSLVREDVRNRYANKSWDTFNTFLQQTPPLNGGKLGFYYKDNEIIPPLPVGFHRYTLSNLDGCTSNGHHKEFDPASEVLPIVNGDTSNGVHKAFDPASEVLPIVNGNVSNGVHKAFDPASEVLSNINGYNSNGVHQEVKSFDPAFEVLSKINGDASNGIQQEVKEFDPPAEVRALIEGQILSMRAHAERCGMPSPPNRIIATGGASANECILTSIASIFGCNVYTVQRPDSAPLGAALRAAHGWLCNKKGSFVPISDLYKSKLEKTSLGCKLAVSAGDKELNKRYAVAMKKRMEIENRLVQKLGRC